jgi:hypothetical protein
MQGGNWIQMTFVITITNLTFSLAIDKSSNQLSVNMREINQLQLDAYRGEITSSLVIDVKAYFTIGSQVGLTS